MAGASAADAVVYIQQAPGTFTPGDAVVMNQRSSEFIPRVLPIVAGTTVKFPNADPIAHNVFSPDFEKYDLGTWSQGETKDHVFAACAKPPCVYTQLCKIHPQMNAYIVALQNPYFAVTDKSGRYLIDNVPPGDYTMTVWYATRTRQFSPPGRSVTVGAGGPATVDFALAR
jgi:plastocyanin